MSADDFLSYGLIDSSDNDYEVHNDLVRKLGMPSHDQIFAYYPISFSGSHSKNSEIRKINFAKFADDLIHFIENTR